jgi:hypothetical protein
MPLVLLYDFYFVRRADTDFVIEIDGQRHRPDRLPVPIDGSRVFFVRYSSDPREFDLFPAGDRALEALSPDAQGEVEYAGFVHHVLENDGRLEIDELRPATRWAHDVRISFAPAFPDLAALADGVDARGDFTIWMEDSMGQIDGSYRVERRGDAIVVEMHPDGGWRPGVRKWSVRFVFFLVRLFRNWPRTYRWVARLDLAGEDGPKMSSRWHRIE